MQDFPARRHRIQEYIPWLSTPRTLWGATVLFTVALVVIGIVMVSGYSTGAGGGPDSVGREPDGMESGPPGLPGYPGMTGWELLEGEKTNGQISITVHHVFAGEYGIHVVYSIEVEDPNGRLSPDVVTSHFVDGTVTEPIADYLVATNGKASVRVASLGKPASGGTTRGINVAVDTDKGRTDLSLDVIRPERPGGFPGGSSMMSNRDPEVAHLLGGYTASRPRVELFGVVASGVIPTEDAPSYFMIDSEGVIREVTVEEAAALRNEALQESERLHQRQLERHKAYLKEQEAKAAAAPQPQRKQAVSIQLPPGCSEAIPEGSGLIDRARAEEVAVDALSSEAPAVSSVQIERVDAACLATLGWYEQDLLKGQQQTAFDEDSRNLPIWIIQVQGKSRTVRPWDKRLEYGYAIATVNAVTGEIKGQSYMFEPLLRP